MSNFNLTDIERYANIFFESQTPIHFSTVKIIGEKYVICINFKDEIESVRNRKRLLQFVTIYYFGGVQNVKIKIDMKSDDPAKNKKR